MTDIFGICSARETDMAALMKCVTVSLQEEELRRNADLQKFLFVVAGAMIFFMQSGFAMLCAGCVRIKNVQNTMLKNLLDACGAAVAFWLVGFALAFGGQEGDGSLKLIGTQNFLTVGTDPAFWFFQYTFSATSVTIVAGTLAERCQMAAYLCYSVLLAGFVYPVVAHSIWSNNGFLSITTDDPFMGSGAIDFAGSGVVHVTGGTIALYATWVLGPRRGRFFDAQGEPLDVPKEFPGHSVALQLLGTMILWFGWFGFNPGSALLVGSTNVGEIAANAAVSTALAGAAGGVSALFTNLILEERRTGEPSFSLTMCMNGSLSGLVAVTSGCAVVEPWGAVVIGLIAGWVYIWSSGLLIRLRIDDAVDAIPVHMCNGLWGLIATGLLSSPRLLEVTYGNAKHPGFFFTFGSAGGIDATLLVNQLLAGLFIVGWTFIIMFPFFIWLNYMGWFRADSLEELVGLDISYHGGVSGGEKDGVKKEYVEAYKRHKGKLRNRRNNGGDVSSGASNLESISEADRGSNHVPSSRWNSTADPEQNQEAAAEEGLRDE